MDWSPIERKIIRTILYADLFHFPLTREELWRYLIATNSVAYSSFERSLKNLSKIISYRGGYYFFSGNERYVKKRNEYEKYSAKKLKIAKRAAFFLSYIPTVYFIGLSGSVAMHNASREDDIDFFVITKKNTIFTTRLFILAILEALGLRRKKNEKNATNKICINLLVDESHLQWSSFHQDIFTAHEIAQVIPLFERDELYKRFVIANKWIKSFLPNAFKEERVMLFDFGKRDYISMKLLSFLLNLPVIRNGIILVQKQYMSKNKVASIVSNQLLAFYPIDYKTYILNKLATKEDKLRLLTKE